MIKYTLVCNKKHDFESWFANSDAYDAQVKRGLVNCPICGSTKVEKQLMAPSLGRSAKKRASSPPQRDVTPPPAQQPQSPVAMMGPMESEFRQKLKELREHIAKNADYVGPRFSEEARKMHYGESEHRSIYGEASMDDAQELREEGIEFHPMPFLPDDHN